MVRLLSLTVALLASAVAVSAQPAAAPIEYVLSFPEPEHHWMQVAVTVRDVPETPVAFRMSRSSPGRYAAHEFAKNVWAVDAVDGDGRALPVTRVSPHQWDVGGHHGTVTLRYRIYGDRVDGTYLAVDTTHAHMNVPATLMYVPGLADRPSRVTLTQPPGRSWRAATQLFPTASPLVFTAPNLAYLADSPIEFGDIDVRTFTVEAPRGSPPATIRVALHHQGSAADADAYVRDVERIVREEAALMGELPAFEPGSYTFLADYLPWADGDGMEHRNSTVLTSSSGIAASRSFLVATVAHEFFHCWNVERIRPRSLEPFDLADANMSGELWLAEGFTSYVDGLAMLRAGLASFEGTLGRWAGLVNEVQQSPATRIRSAVESSEMAPFVDRASAGDRTNWGNLELSYYTHGAAIAFALDLALRTRSNGETSLDDYMRALWRRFGRPGTAGAPGVVTTPYTLGDLRQVLAETARDERFAADFFTRFVEGRESFDYGAALPALGVVARKARPGQPTLGAVQFDFSRRTAAVSAPTPFGSPAYAAGLDQDDVLDTVDGQPITSAESLRRALEGRRPGDRVTLAFTRRGGEKVTTATATLAEVPTIDLVPIEAAGGTLSPAQRAQRLAWIASRVR